jgi:hypothetical protein
MKISLAFLLAFATAASAAPYVVGPEQFIAPTTLGALCCFQGPAVTATQDGFLAAWRGMSIGRTPGAIAVMPFGTDGQPTRPQYAVIGSSFSNPGIASTGIDALVAWGDGGGITAQHVGLNGTRAGEATHLLPATSGKSNGETRVVWNGAHYFAVTTSYTLLNSGIAARNIVATIEGTATPLNLGSGELADVAAAAGQALVLSIDNNTLLGRYVSSAGVVSAPFTIAANAVSAAVSSDGVRFLALWSDSTQILGAYIDGGTVGAPFRVGGSQTPGAPSVTWTGSHFAATFADGNDLMLADISGSSVMLSTTGDPSTRPAVAALGERVAVVIARGPIVARIAEGDTLTDAAPLSRMVQGQYEPKLAGSLVFFARSPNDAFTELVVAANGVVSPISDDLTTYDVAAHGDGMATAAWIDSKSRVHAARVNTNGVAVATLLDDAATVSGKIAIATNGSEDLVVWRNGFALRAARLGAGGAIDDVQLSRGTGQPPIDVRAAWNGSAYVVVWEEPQPVTFDGWLLKSAIVGADGTRTDERIALTFPLGGNLAAMTASADGTLVVWTKDGTSGSELHAMRLDARGLPESDVIVARNSESFVWASAAPAVGGFQIFWSVTSGVSCTLIDANLGTFSTAPLLATAFALRPSIATTKAGPYAMAYSTFDAGENVRVAARTIAAPIHRRPTR